MMMMMMMVIYVVGFVSRRKVDIAAWEAKEICSVIAATSVARLVDFMSTLI
jgi:hypothetical protein